MKKSSLLFIAYLFLQFVSFAQAPDTMWTKTFGLINADIGFSVIETNDGGFVIAGIANTTDLGIMKTDSNGNLLWLKTIGGASVDVGYKVEQTSDGGFIIAGATNSSGAGGYDAWLIKVDSSGNQQWSQTYGGNDNDYGLSLRQIPSGGYIIGGYTSSYGAGLNDVWLIRVDPNGTPIWEKTYGAAGEDFGYSVELTSDGGFVIVGSQNSFTAGGYDIGFLKADQNGNLVWLKNFGGTQDDWGYSVKRTSDGGFIITGFTESTGLGGRDVWLIKTDSDGNEQWTRPYGGVEDDEGRDVDETSDGGFIITGKTKSFGAGNEDVGFLKTDQAGNLIWITTYGGGQNDFGYSVKQTSDGGYIITGGTYSFGAGSADVWLIKTESDVSVVNTQTVVKEFNLCQNYPNPFNPSTKIKYQIPALSFVSIKIYDVLGNEIASPIYEEKPVGTYEIEFNASALSSGVYFYRLKAGDFAETKKMLLLR